MDCVALLLLSRSIDCLHQSYWSMDGKPARPSRNPMMAGDDEDCKTTTNFPLTSHLICLPSPHPTPNRTHSDGSPIPRSCIAPQTASQKLLHVGRASRVGAGSRTRPLTPNGPFCHLASAAGANGGPCSSGAVGAGAGAARARAALPRTRRGRPYRCARVMLLLSCHALMILTSYAPPPTHTSLDMHVPPVLAPGRFVVRHS